MNSVQRTVQLLVTFKTILNLNTKLYSMGMQRFTYKDSLRMDSHGARFESVIIFLPHNVQQAVFSKIKDLTFFLDLFFTSVLFHM